MAAYTQRSYRRRHIRNTYRVKKKRFLPFVGLMILLFLIARIFSNYDYNIHQYRLGDFDPEHLSMYFSVEKETQVPWHILAAVDKAEQVEFDDIRIDRSSRIALHIKGIEESDRINDYLKEYNDDENFLEAVKKELKQYDIVNKIYKDKIFPIDSGYEYSYNDDFGAGRTYGGERLHEGIDIFCEMGVPIVSIGEGKVEKKGWNEYGGWRIGIRGDDGVYYYYAHLSRYEPGIDIGHRIKKGEIIGYVGDSGYGDEGTTGKFAPHLHFGMYEGRDMEAVNPYPLLKVWERRELS